MGRLLYCPTCRQSWPQGAEHDLRGFGWLERLPRHISPSNLDAIIHDGNGANRFLILETKMNEEKWQTGQLLLLRALARLPAVDVFVLHGSPQQTTASRVSPAGLLHGVTTTAAAFRDFVVAWIEKRAAEPSIPGEACGAGGAGATQLEPCLKPRNHAGPHRSENAVWPNRSAA